MNTPIDLTTQKYPINDLIWNIYALDFLEVLRTQHLTEEFTVDYILNKDYQMTELEQMITIKTVLHLFSFQTPINYNINKMI